MRINSNCNEVLKKKRRVIAIQSNISKDYSKLNGDSISQVRDVVNDSKHSSDNNNEQQIQWKRQYQAQHLDTDQKKKLDTNIIVARQNNLIEKRNSKQALLSGLQEQIKKARSCQQKYNNYKQLIQKYEKYRMKSNIMETKSSQVRRLNHYLSQQQINHYYPTIEEMLRHQNYNGKNYTNINKNYTNSNINKNYNSLSTKTLIVKKNQVERSFQMKNNQNLKNLIKKTNNHEEEGQPYTITINQMNKCRMQQKFNQKDLNEMNPIKHKNRKKEFDIDDYDEISLDKVNNEQKGLNTQFIQKIQKSVQYYNKTLSNNQQYENTNHQQQKTNSQHSNNSYQSVSKQQPIEINTNSNISKQQQSESKINIINNQNITNNTINNKNIINNNNTISNNNHKQQAYIKQLHQKYLSLNENYNKYLKQTKQLNNKFEREKEYLLKIKTQHFQNQQLIDQLMYMVRNRNYQLLESGGDGCQQLGKPSIEVQTQQLGQIYQEEETVKLRKDDDKQVQGYDKSIRNNTIANNGPQLEVANSRQPAPNTQLYCPSPLTQNNNSIRELRKDLFEVKKLIVGQKSFSKYRFQPSII